MTQNDGGYDLTPPEPPREIPPAAPTTISPKPGDPDFVPPIPIIEKADPPAPDAPLEYDPDLDPDIKQHKGIAILAYILFIFPLVLAPNSKFARYHANQGLIIFILWWIAIITIVILFFAKMLTNYLFAKIDILVDFFSCIIFLAQPALLVGVLILAVYGIIHAANGEKKPLPFFGHFTLIK